MTTFSIVQSLTYAVKTFFSHLVFFIVSALVALATIVVYGMATLFIMFGMGGGREFFGVEMAFTKIQELSDSMVSLSAPLFVYVIGALLMIGLSLLYILFGLGYQRAALTLYDTNSVRVADIFSQWRLVGWMIVGRLAYALIVAAGLVLFIVPGVYFGIKFWFYPYALIGNQGSVVAAFKHSSAVVTGSWWRVFLFAVLCNILISLGSLVYGIGLLIALPVVLLAEAYVYRKLVYAHDHAR